VRVAVVSQSDVTAFIGGQEQHILSLAGTLKTMGHQVAIAVPGRSSGYTLLADGVEVVHLRAGFSYTGSFYRAAAVHPQFPDPGFVLSLRWFFKERQPHLVHSHGLAILSVGTALRGLNMPWVHTLHDYSLLCPKGSLWKLPEEVPCKRPMTAACIPCHGREAPRSLLSPLRPLAILPALALSRAILPLADRYIAVSKFVATAHRQFLPNVGHRITVLPNFLPRRYNGLNLCEGLPESPFVLFAGSAAAQKGAHILLEAFRGVPGDVSLVLMVTGPAAWLGSLRSKADDRTLFYHNAPHSLVMAGWDQALLGIVPSLWPEPCPTVAFESMSHGKPVVASAVGGLTDVVVDGDTGVLVPPGDVEALRLALEHLIENDGLRQQMGQAARERFEREFSAEVVVPQIEELYSQLLMDNAWAL
jgi:glycosyltransferase involved in cell wall biosynthesis